MRLLELFSGTGSIGRAFEALGWEVTSLDLEGEPTIKCDILDWDYTTFPPGHSQVVWASWGLENPQSGLLKTRRDMEGLSFVPRPQCFKGSRCQGFRDGCHPTRAQRGSHCQQQLYTIPRELCEEIAASAFTPARSSRAPEEM